MQREIYRTNTTSLSGDELLILDVMFDSCAAYVQLRQCNFIAQHNVPPHSLDDAALKSTLQRLLHEKIIEPTGGEFHGHPYLALTKHGGALWSAERCPVWQRYCYDRYRAVIRGRQIMSVAAVSADTCDDFVRVWSRSLARYKKYAIRDTGLIPWHPFGTIHALVASYDEEQDCTCDVSSSARTWWRKVDELQKFIGAKDGL
jgi:hypothetical protein